jgi:serine/threonine protein phosphatase PrpC
MTYIKAAKSITGLRETNQDCFAEFVFKNIQFMLVCDGNGGEDAEKVALSAAEYFIGALVYRLSHEEDIDEGTIQRIGIEAIKRTADSIYNLKRVCPKFSSCGTTLTLVCIYKSTVIAFWVGDSPAIIRKGDKVILLTDPLHTLSEHLIAQGTPQEDVVNQKGLSSILTRCIGHKDAKPDTKIMKLQPPFTVIVASDGIDDLPNDGLKAILSKNCLTKELPEKLINASLQHGSTDNITVAATKVLRTPKRIRREIWARKIVERNRGRLCRTAK